uniref:Uncharacterized protein n=1 Tax=Molossus molossus TaxID=27622 RepID=A0A7J8DPM6_MOLMO|nr:hypothetical protein HJG59_009235 [Molossus molossus]
MGECPVVHAPTSQLLIPRARSPFSPPTSPASARKAVGRQDWVRSEDAVLESEPPNNQVTSVCTALWSEISRMKSSRKPLTFTEVRVLAVKSETKQKEVARVCKCLPGTPSDWWSRKTDQEGSHHRGGKRCLLDEVPFSQGA